ncbi:rod shape-determining protein RodA [Patescibacteria group bacterium]|nr:rod shape-determining protein RodA [Patescibacteria group bacterium]MBU4367332.1 rod shape-determining protein RodA [Patescibacteria group bacterium]MBU4461669.1 rod shape-determining protein RodA [Patescibacteria group bacterium]MCG2699720.1 rod shape-determining protein RodA [Candidatus Parcubacteria bacterium]
MFGNLSFKPLRAHLRRLDWLLAGSAILLTIIGLLAIYSSSLRKGDFLNFKKQILFFTVGFILMILISFFDHRVLKNNSYLILILYFLALLFLIGLFFFAPEIRGKRGWYKFGVMSFDPIELLKITLIILLAKYFSMRHAEMYRFWHIVFSGIYVLVPCLLIFFQPDLGAVLILVIVWLSILLISGIKIRHFLILSLVGLILLLLSWQFLLHDYQKSRVLDFIFPYDPLGTSWSQSQAEIAIGSGQIFGRGFTKGSQTQYGFLPEPHTDFIFSVVAEESGLVGVLLVFFLYSILIWRTIKIAVMSRSNFPRLFASGFAVILIAQFFINIGMNAGILPVIGIYLPLISYGGSGLIGTFVGLGIIQSIKIKT